MTVPFHPDVATTLSSQGWRTERVSCAVLKDFKGPLDKAAGLCRDREPSVVMEVRAAVDVRRREIIQSEEGSEYVSVFVRAYMTAVCWR